MSTSQIIVNRFEISDLEGDLLRKGGMGNVYRGTDLQNGHPVAIKVVKPDLIGNDPNLIARFKREGEALRQLSHSNIVKMVTAVQDQERQYLIMEYIGGGSLRDLLEAEGTLPVARTLKLTISLANALFHAHCRRIVHRDLKPTNVLLAKDGTPRLTDFGVAYIADGTRLTQTGTRLGTINYFSPEACSGEKLDERADVWALGVMLYEMLAGERPFIGKNIGATAMAILTESIPNLPQIRTSISPTLADLVNHMLEKNRDQRIPNMALVEAALKLEVKLRERGETFGGSFRP
ncbi:MAG: serine/threonine protein kinase [Chloroflexi bacterium]|nr:serine/threonine protein kinase [Chloroflexota bacterium]